MKKIICLVFVLVIALLLPNASAQADTPRQNTKPNTPIEHFIVLMQENHTFDNYFGTYPGADGIPVIVEVVERAAVRGRSTGGCGSADGPGARVVRFDVDELLRSQLRRVYC